MSPGRTDLTDEQTNATLRHRLYHGDTSYDFVGRRRWWFAFSALVILIGMVSLLVEGLNYGIDFKGGTSWEIIAPGVSVPEARDAVAPLGLGEAKIQIAGGDILRVQAQNQSPENTIKVTERLASLAKAEPAQVSVNDVGPSWGKDVTKKARNALVVFFVLISAYIALRFEWKMALAAMSAVVHDILVTVGVYSLSRFEVTPATVVAFLTILGYSLYDTVVVFDKVEENVKASSAAGRTTYSDIVDLSMNQVLMRSINTSFVAIMPVLSVLVVGWGLMGAIALKDFGLALLIGLITGAYSSIFIASPVLAMVKEREPRYQMIRQRAMSKSGGGGVLTPAGAAAGRNGAKSGKGRSPEAPDDDDDDLLVPATKQAGAQKAGTTAGNRSPAAPRPSSRAVAPRPRKKGKKR